MRRYSEKLASGILVIGLMTPSALAESGKRPAMASKTVIEDTEDYLLRPVRDTNLRKSQVVVVLRAAVENPYDATGLDNCRRIAAAVAELDLALGPDLDSPRIRKGENGFQTAGRIGLATAKEFIGGIVPVRSIVREVSGARASDARYREALYAGSVRRAFLKGLGFARLCKAPAAPIRLAPTTADAASNPPRGVQTDG